MFSHTLATRKLHITKRLVELDNHICDSPAETHGYFFLYHVTERQLSHHWI